MFYYSRLQQNTAFVAHVLAFTLALILPQTSYAENTFSLKDSIGFALEHNRMLSVASSNVDAAHAQADQSTGQLMPRIDVSTGFYRTNSPLNSFGTKLQQQQVSAADFDPNVLNNPVYINNYHSRLGLSLPLFSGGASWAAHDGAQANATASEFEYAFRKQQLTYQTISSYVQSRQALAQVSAQENAVNAANKRWQDAKALKKRGISIESDVMDAHVHLLRSKVGLDQAKGSYADSIESLRYVLGMPMGQELGALTEPNIDITEQNLDTLVDLALSQRADLSALENQVEAANASYRQAQAGYYPHVNLVAAQEWNSDTFGLDNGNAMVGVNITMNIFAGGTDSAQSRAAESKRIMMDLQLEDKQQHIRNEVRQAWRSVNIAKNRLEGESEALKQTTESLRIKSLRHRQGLEKTSDLLDAQVRADASKVAHIRAKYDYMIAKAALLLASGSLNAEVVR